MQLADDHPFRTVDDELAPAHHDRNLAEVDLLLRDLVNPLADQPHRDPKRHPVRQTKLAAFVRRVPRLIQLVIKVFKAHRPVVGFDREYLAQQRRQADLLVSLVRRQMLLKVPLVRSRLDLRQRRHSNRIAALREIAHVLCNHQFTSKVDTKGACRSPGS